MIERRQQDTGSGVAYVDVLVCDHCGNEAAEDSATGWAQISTVGISTQTLDQYPELVVCSWPCLRAVNRRFPLNTEPQESRKAEQ